MAGNKNASRALLANPLAREPAMANSFKLTQAAVERLKPSPSGDVEYWDKILPGFGVRTSFTGRKSWLATYRVAGKFKMKVLGTTALIPKVEDARNEARAMMQQAKKGIDPVMAKREQKAAEEAATQAQTETFSWLVERFIREYAEVKQRPPNLRDTKRLLNRILPELGSKLARVINKADIVAVLDDIAATRRRPLKGHDGAPKAEARAVQVCLRTLFRWAAFEDLVEVNPMLAIRPDRYGKPVARSRVLSDAEIRAFWRGCDRLGWPFGTIGQLLLLTGARENEIAGMRWTELDLVEERVRTLPDVRAKGGQVTVNPLSDMALAIINKVPYIEDLLFSTNGVTPCSGFGYVKVELDAMMRAELAESGLTLQPWVWHDLRRSARTLMSRAGVRPGIAERVLDHAVGGVQEVYDRWDFIAEKRSAVAALAAMIERILGDNVVVVELQRA
jgi:integrase